MALQYYLIDNPITPDPNDRRAVPVITKFFDMNDVYNQMLSRGTSITKGVALATIEELTIAFFTML
jgi:hypothetical protein